MISFQSSSPWTFLQKALPSCLPRPLKLVRILDFDPMSPMSPKRSCSPYLRANPTAQAFIAVIALCTGSIMAQGTQLVAIPLSSNADNNFFVGLSFLGFVAVTTIFAGAAIFSSALAFSASTHGSGIVHPHPTVQVITNTCERRVRRPGHLPVLVIHLA